MFRTFTKEEWLIVLLTVSIFTPYYITGLVVLGVVLYLAIHRQLLSCIQIVPKAKILLIFCGGSALVSLLYQNWIGLACSAGMALLFMFIFFYRTIIHKELFEFLLDCILIMSLINVAYAWIEYGQICARLNLNVWDLVVKNRPENRVHTVFFNANYYAMMIEFCVLICVYKIMSVKKIIPFVYYAFVIVTNWFCLYLTGCRTAWIPFVVSVPIMFWICRSYVYLSLSLLGAGSIGGLVFCKPELLQRITLAKDFGKRTRIWKAAVQGIQDNFVFGQGPLTYFKIYPLYDGHPTQHAHNIYLDLMLSHGVVGVLLLLVYIGSNMKEVILLIKDKQDVRLGALIVGFLITVLMHGLLDHTLFWIQTSLLFFIVFSSSSMYFHSQYEKKH